MKQQKKITSVSGVVAPGARPTLLAAALLATALSAPFWIGGILFELLT